jgi:hypothetical protein
MKLQSQNTSQKLTASLISLKCLILTSEWNVNSVKHSTETLSLSICSDKLDNINSRLHTKATLSFIESSLSLSNNNTITVLFYNVTEMVNLTDLNSELTHSLILIDFSEHTVISQSTSQQLITILSCLIR